MSFPSAPAPSIEPRLAIRFLYDIIHVSKRDGMGREVGGVLRIGNVCTPVADAC